MSGEYERDETNGCTGTGKPALTYTITGKGVLTVPGTPSAIGESAFRGRDELTDVRLPDSVVRIEDRIICTRDTSRACISGTGKGRMTSCR